MVAGAPLEMRRGEIWWVNLAPPWGRRPVLLVARTEVYDILTWVIVAPITTTLRDTPTVVALDPRADGIPQRSVVSLDSIQLARREWFDTLITRLGQERMDEVDQAIHFALGLRH